MLTYIDFCLEILKIIKEEKIECQELSKLVNYTIDKLDQQQEPTDTYEEIIAKQLLFYRNECLYLNKLRQQQQKQITSLKKQLLEAKESYQSLTNLLKQQKQEQFINQNKTEEINNNTSRSDAFKPNLKQIKETTPIKATYQLNQSQIQNQMAPHLTIEIKNIKTPLMEYHEPKNLKELFEECVQQIYRENKLRGNLQSKYPQNCNKNHFRQTLLTEDYRNIEISKLDIKSLTERFFLNPHFIKMVEAQIFQIKCCNNKACLYNFKTNQFTQETQITDINRNEKSLPKKLSNFREESRSKSVGRSDDLRLQYQWLFAEVLRLEKEISSTPKSNKVKVIELKQQLKDTSQKLNELQSKILN